MKMNIKKMLIIFVSIFVLTLAVSAITTYLYSLIAYGAGVIYWETSFRFAIIFGIILTFMKGRERKEK
jgi:hypothetical protein